MMEVLFWSAPTVAENVALDERMARSAFSAGRSTLRFWWGGPPAVVMGWSERAEPSVHSDACAELGVEVLKRCTGGGTVLQTSGVLNYSLITPAPDHLDLMAGFRQGTDLVCTLLDTFGLVGVVQGTCDVAVAGQKISGNAQARRWRSMLVHGTLLVDFDVDLAEKLLPHPPREPEYRQARRHRDFLVTLRRLGVTADRGTVERVALQVGQRLFRSALVSGAPESVSFDTHAHCPLRTGQAALSRSLGGRAMNSKIFFRTVLLLFIAACIFFFSRDHFHGQPGHAVQSSSQTAAATSDARDATSISANARVIVYFFHGHRQCPSCRHLEAVSESAISDGFPDAMRSGVILWRAVDIEDPANRHFAADYQVYWSSLVLVKVKAGRPIGYKNLEHAWQLQQDDQALRSYVQAEVRAYLGAG